jgi:cyclopropane-fatty-acyl-phospholipid synthase
MSVVTAPSAKYGGSAEAIRHHYDVGNDLWRIMLGPTMTYSAALFERPDEDLEAAQFRKVDWHLASAGVHQAASLLEVGYGWGTLVRRVSEMPHVKRIVGLTLSDAQAEYVQSLRLDRVELRTENWSAHRPTAPYDAIVSIGAFEHFAKPEETLDEKMAMYRDFFARCRSWLSPTGRMSLQTIAYGTMRPEDASEFMQREIYPESELPFLGELVAAVDGVFEIVAVRNDRLHYARSYDRWAHNLRTHRAEAVAVVGEEVVRRFECFFKLGSIGFRMGKLSLLRLALRPIRREWTVTGADAGAPPLRFA